MRCTVADCQNNARARKLCTKHYQRMRAHGDPTAAVQVRGDDERRWHGKVDVTAGPDACWPWLAGRDEDGYGLWWSTRKGSETRAHRESWRRTHGPAPTGLQVLHSCDNPPCVNPAHLWVGTGQENHLDKLAKGRARGNTVLGSIPRKLTDEQVRDLLANYTGAWGEQTRIAEALGVTRQYVGQLIRSNRDTGSPDARRKGAQREER